VLQLSQIDILKTQTLLTPQHQMLYAIDPTDEISHRDRQMTSKLEFVTRIKEYRSK
jgi:hypothetical protein